MELAAIGDDHKALRAIARKLINQAMEDGKLDAIKELADRTDGKVAQAIVGDDEYDAINVVTKIVREIVRPQPVDPNG